jgi:hypothetical protein
MEGLNNLVEELRVNIEIRKNKIIEQKLSEINKHYLIDECKRKSKFKPIIYATIQGTNKEEVWIDDNSNNGQLLVTFELVFDGVVPELKWY